MKKILIADDHQAVRIGLRSIIASVETWKVSGEASCPTALMAMLRRSAVDAVVMDYNMPDDYRSDGSDLVRAINCLPDAPVTVVLTGLANARLLRGCLRAGATALVSKSCPEHCLVRALSAALVGNMGVCEHMQATLISGERCPSMALSREQLDVVRLLGSGRTVTGMAATKGRHVSTISSHKRAAMRRLGFRSMRDLFEWAVKAGLALPA